MIGAKTYCQRISLQFIQPRLSLTWCSSDQVARREPDGVEFLDAQRTLRQIQLDLVTTRGAMERAGIEIERLAGAAR